MTAKPDVLVLARQLAQPLEQAVARKRWQGAERGASDAGPGQAGQLGGGGGPLFAQLPDEKVELAGRPACQPCLESALVEQQSTSTGPVPPAWPAKRGGPLRGQLIVGDLHRGCLLAGRPAPSATSG